MSARRAQVRSSSCLTLSPGALVLDPIEPTHFGYRGEAGAQGRRQGLQSRARASSGEALGLPPRDSSAPPTPHHATRFRVFREQSHFGLPGGDSGVGPQTCQDSPGAAAVCQRQCLSWEVPAPRPTTPDTTFPPSVSTELAAGLGRAGGPEPGGEARTAGPASPARALRPALEQPSQPTPLTRGWPTIREGGMRTDWEGWRRRDHGVSY